MLSTRPCRQPLFGLSVWVIKKSYSHLVPTAASWTWCLGGQTCFTRCERRLPRRGLGIVHRRRRSLLTRLRERGRYTPLGCYVYLAWCHNPACIKRLEETMWRAAPSLHLALCRLGVAQQQQRCVDFSRTAAAARHLAPGGDIYRNNNKCIIVHPKMRRQSLNGPRQTATG